MKTVKTILATTSVFLCFSFVVWGQSSPLKVTGNGVKVSYQKSTTSTLQGLSSVVNQGVGGQNGECIGIFGLADAISTSYSNIYIGVAGNAISSYTGVRASIGIAGMVRSNNGAAIYGSNKYGAHLSAISFNFPNTSYAGYFDGDVKVTGYLTTTLGTCSSDERLKRNIEAIGKENIIEKLSALRPVKYNLRQIERDGDSINAKGEKVTFKIKRFDEEAQYFKKEHYGLVAQELQKVYPELVYEEGDGYLSINYTGLIPLLLQAIQEQQKQIEELQTKNPYYYFIDETEDNPTQPQPSKAPQQQTNSADNMLYQNAPNPFNISTTIKYQLSDNATNAKICIYNLTGKQVQCYNLQATKGENSIEVRASSLQAGMYLYSLIVNDELINTKRMILTE